MNVQRPFETADRELTPKRRKDYERQERARSLVEHRNKDKDPKIGESDLWGEAGRREHPVFKQF